MSWRICFFGVCLIAPLVSGPCWSQAITHLYFGAGGFDSQLDQQSVGSSVQFSGTSGDETSSAAEVFALSPLNDSDTGWRLVYGYQFRKHFAFEGGYISAGEYAFEGSRALSDVTFTSPEESFGPFDTIGPASASVKYQGFTVSGLATWPVTKRLSLKAKLGIALLSVEQTINFDGYLFNETGVDQTFPLRGSTNESQIPFLFGADVSYRVTKHWVLSVYAERMFDLDGTVFGDSSDLDMLGAQLIFRY